jgi:hypothetical protein
MAAEGESTEMIPSMLWFSVPVLNVFSALNLAFQGWYDTGKWNLVVNSELLFAILTATIFKYTKATDANFLQVQDGWLIAAAAFEILNSFLWVLAASDDSLKNDKTTWLDLMIHAFNLASCSWTLIYATPQFYEAEETEPDTQFEL